MPATERPVIGWDVGGAHVKACLLRGGEVTDVAQWACPLWQGMEHLEHTLQSACRRWPMADDAAHAVTMTGEMVDLFSDRQEGVKRIALQMMRTLQPAQDGDAMRFFAGDAGWCRIDEVPAQWERIASANWLATARHAAHAVGDGVLVDIGSTTTDFVAFRGGQVLGHSRTDAERLATGELVYLGVVRTPLFALARRIGWRGRMLNVMNEYFATVADVYRLTGELQADHDLYPTADNAPKSPLATRRRLARMIGLDEHDGTADEWLAFARAWRQHQVDELGGQLHRVLQAHSLPSSAAYVSAGCGDFLAADVVAHAATLAGQGRLPMRGMAYGSGVAKVSADARSGAAPVRAWAQVCAPCVAVAALLDAELRRCG
ncbi:hydantoinase/oxoprolinase family protein [Ideonella sp. DXS29W]|uniref:Hydantoinase/oxoprolinase family protein n=1 Tax=Ideonella lacteola TaxID=2984193 RepID=A0ABU9BIB2_9BURK